MNSIIIEQLKKADVIDSTGKITLANLATYTLNHDILVVMHNVVVGENVDTYVRAVINKWTFQDKAMGEQFITFDYMSEEPVAWAIGDYCLFRGEVYSLNYIPSVTQKANRGKVLDSYKYEGVKMNSRQDELTRCQMRDIVLTSEQHSADEGTNYTGSVVFPLFCGETVVEIAGETIVRPPVAVLADRMLANLNAMYHDNEGNGLWNIYINYETSHSDDKTISFNNQYVSQALAEVKNTFDINYCVKGRNIYIGYDMADITGDTQEDTYNFGYGPGYPTPEADGKGLFEIKKVSDSSQQIVTRLRVMGSSKNLPYRYYNKHYDLPQALFPTTLQLPDTFLPEGDPDDAPGTNTKWGHNNGRSSSLNAVLGDSNDAYIDKNNNAAGELEGVREATLRFDGSDSEVEEIYPSIEGLTYDELRDAVGLKDIDGTETPSPSAFPNYDAGENINELLAVGYKYNGEMVDDANIGNGILDEDSIATHGIINNVSNIETTEQLFPVDDIFVGIERTLLTINAAQTKGRYCLVPVVGKEPYFEYQATASNIPVAYKITIKQTISDVTTVIAEYVSDWMAGIQSVPLPTLPDALLMDNAKVKEINVTGTATIEVTFTPMTKGTSMLQFRIGLKEDTEGLSQYVWCSLAYADTSNLPFHVFIKDIGFDLKAQFNGDTPMISMKSGQCVGRDFQIGDVIETVEYGNKKGYMLVLTRAQDTSLNTYYPNSRNSIAAGDSFVITGIDMPDAFIQAAEVKMLKAASDWLRDNGSTHFKYQPSIDDIFLKRNYDNMIALGTVEKSVYWRLYAGLKLSFYGIPDTPDADRPLESITIDSVSLTLGEGLTRKVEIVLNDEPQQSTLQKVTTSVDNINKELQSRGSGMSSVTMENTVMQIGDKRYISKVYTDTADNDITFNGVITFTQKPHFVGGALFGLQEDGEAGAEIDNRGNIHSKQSVTGDKGVAARGIADLSMIQGGGGGGGSTSVKLDPNTPYVENEDYEPVDGKVKLPSYKWSNIQGKPVVPSVVAFDSLNADSAEDLTKVASAKSVAVLKKRLDYESLHLFSTETDYYRGDCVKTEDGFGIASGWRFVADKEAGPWIGAYVEPLNAEALATPLDIPLTTLNNIINI